MLEIRVEPVFQLGYPRDAADCFLDESVTRPSNTFVKKITLCIHLYVPKAAPNGVQMFLRLSYHSKWTGERTTENSEGAKGKSRRS